MKKVFFGFVALSLIMLVTSCNNETVEVNPDLGNMLTFKAATGKQTLTRASEVNLGILQDQTLEVETFLEDGSPYNVYSITHDGSLWSYDTPEYHPLTYSLYHFSVYPSNVGMTHNGVGPDGGTVTILYTVGETDVDQIDLMVASATSEPSDGKANLLYKHILSQVNFAIQGMKNLIVEVRDISLSGIFETGTYTFSTSSSSWSELKDQVNYFYNPVTTAATPGDNDLEIIYLGNTGDGPGVTGPDNSKSNALMLLPQTLTNDAKLTFSYKLYNKETPDNILFDDDFIISLDQQGITEWLEGKRYLYKLIFNPVMLEFEVDVAENGWVDHDHPNGGFVDVNTYPND